MLFWNIFVFFLLPLLVLFLTRKLSVRGMILWTAGVQVVALLLRMVVYPVRLSLSWGMSLLESLSYSNLSAWYSGSGVQLIYLAVISLVFIPPLSSPALQGSERKEVSSKKSQRPEGAFLPAFTVCDLIFELGVDIILPNQDLLNHD